MRQKLLIFLALLALAAILVGLNAASYVQKPTAPDTEAFANRSTYNAGATGTRAFFELLAETGRKPVRWQEKPAALLGNAKNKPQTFVIIGATPREITDVEAEQILRWVSEGGKLIVIDREPPKELLATTANWLITALPSVAVPNADPSNPAQMTDEVIAAKPLQPTVFTRGVNAVMPSRFASSVKLEFFGADETTKITGVSPTATPEDDDYETEDEPPAAKAPNGVGSGSGDEVGSEKPAAAPSPRREYAVRILQAPFVHAANNEKTLLVDFPYGAGQIVYLSDPYIVSNGGISLADNAQMAINVVASRNGAIAFDEYHHGYGAGENRLLAYFAETPLPAIFAQFALLVGFILWSQSRRFARPLPAVEPDRLSKLEYVSAMAELQQRTRAYDLAIENIYSEFRRRATRFLGVDNFTTSRKELATLVAERAKLDAGVVESLLRKCEDIIHGAPTGKKEVLEITRRLREWEEKLGLKRTRKQAFRK